MMGLDWVKARVKAALMPDVDDINVDDNLYAWLEREQAALRARLEADREVIGRRADASGQERPEDAR